MEKMKTIKTVVCDIDGTLLEKGEMLPSKVVTRIKLLKEYKIDFVFASGRLPSRIHPLVVQLQQEDMFVVACNGALVYQGDTIIFEHVFPVKLLESLVRLADSFDMTVLYSLGGVEYCHRETAASKRKRRERGDYFAIQPLDFATMQLIKVNILTENALYLLDEELQKLEGLVNITRYGNQGVEIVHKDVSKKTGIDHYCRLKKREFSTIMAIGDNENDIALFKASGIAVAVANASSDAKRSAQIVTSLSSADGVGEILAQLLDTQERK
ncbi:HAD family hydrolase [Streptococcus cuniculi]|nr:HAD family hydrolase [Streptococcus cuniculi]